MTFKGVRSGEFSKINCELIDQVEDGREIKLNNYNWQRNFDVGVKYVAEDANSQYKDGENQKVLRNEAQLQKYNL